MTRRAAKVDTNQPDVVRDLRQMGVSVTHLHSVGMGCPDILCGWRGANYAFEIKDGSLPPSGRRLTPMEKRWHDDWRGQVAVIHTAEEALEIMQRASATTVPVIGEIGG